MRPRTVLLIYGEGGHRAQMKRLYGHLKPGLDRSDLKVVGICENNDALSGFRSFSLLGGRDKHSRLKSLVTLPLSVLCSVTLVSVLMLRYRIVGVISTGPGIAVAPSIMLKLFRARIIFLESWSRFETQSMTGKIMYRIADRFYIQHQSLQDLYKKAIYGGLL